MARHFDDVTEEEWAQVFGPPGHPERNPRGLRFRNNLALMFTSTPPYFAPAEADYRLYFFHLRSIYKRRWTVNWVGERPKDAPPLEEVDGCELLIRAMERVGKVPLEQRPSPGSVGAHAMALVVNSALALPAKPYQPPTPEQWAELAEIKARIMGRFDIENLDSKNTERKEAT